MPLNEEDRENLVAYLDGELDDEAAQTLEARMNLDPEFRAEADAMKQAWGMLDYLPRPEPSSSFTHRTLEKLALHKPVETARMPRLGATPWLKAAGVAAGIVVAAALGFGLMFWLGPRSPGDASEDEQLVRYLRVLEKMPWYEQVEDLDFLRALDHPDLFGDDTGS